MLIRVMVNRGLRRSQIFWIGIIIFGLFVSLGSYLPLAGWLAELPGFNLLRVPARALFITSIGLAAVGAAGMEALILQASLPAPGDRIANLLNVAVTVLLLALSATIFLVNGEIPGAFVWAGCLALILMVCSLGVKNGILGTGTFLWLSIAIVWIDLLVVGASFFNFRTQEDVYNEGQSVAEFLAEQPGQFRIYSPSYSIPQHTAARYGLELADGVDPLQLASYASFMVDTTGVTAEGYSVTLPPFANGNPPVDNTNFIPDPEKLGLLNVRFLVSAFPLAADGLELLETSEAVYIYENRHVLPRAWVQSSDRLVDREIISFPRIIQWEANSITISAEGPGLLVISQPAYPGWALWLDGNRHAIQTFGGLLKSVTLPPGEHEVVLKFIPVKMYAGLVLSVIALGVGLRLSRQERANG